MRKIDRMLHEYGESHRNTVNEIIHWMCVPAIFLSIVGLIAAIPPEPLWAWAALGLVMIYYVVLSPSLAVGMLLFSAGCLALVHVIREPLVFLAIFGVAWVFQFIGHRVEGKKPSFLKDVQFLLIGPAWFPSRPHRPR